MYSSPDAINPTGPFTFLEPRGQEISEFYYVIQERRETDFVVLLVTSVLQRFVLFTISIDVHDCGYLQEK